MTLPDYFTQHLRGAWRLLRWDVDGLQEFDLTADGFYRSFWAIAAAFVLMVPAFAADHRVGMAFAAHAEDVQFAMPLGVYVATEMGVAAIGWATFLLMMSPAARALGAGDRYAIFVIVYNWASLLVVSLTLPLAVAQLSGIASWDITLAVQFVLALVFLVFSWFVARVALDLEGLDAAAVVALEVVIFVLLAYPTEAFYSSFIGAPA